MSRNTASTGPVQATARRRAFKTQLADDAASLDEYLDGATAGKIVKLAATG